MSSADVAQPVLPIAGRVVGGGIDVGGTKISAGVVTDRGEVRELRTVATVPWDGAANLELTRQLLAVVARQGVAHIGLSIATTIDGAGRARDPHGYFGWNRVDLAAELSEEACTVHVFHDAVSGAVAEYRHGAGAGVDHLLYVTVGTGLSHCLVRQGRPYAGAHGMAYLSGYIHPAPCGQPGCRGTTVEDVVSGPAIATAFVPGTTDARAVCSASAAGDSVAAAVLDHAAWHLGTFIADLVNVLDPAAVVLGGGLGYGAPVYRERAFAVARDLLSSRGRPEVTFAVSRYGPMSCWLGAADLARERAQGTPQAAQPKVVGGA